MIRLVLLICACAGPSAAQTSFQPLAAGAVYHHGSRTIQPLAGIPGSSYLGSPVLSGVEAASIAPGGTKAWVQTEGGSGFRTGLLGSAPADLPVKGLIDGVKRVVWSRDGSASIVYALHAKQFQLVHFAGDSAVADAPIEIAGLLGPRSLTALAIDPAGRRIAFGVASSDGGALYEWTAAEGPIRLGSMTNPRLAAFYDGGNRLYVIDGESRKILAFDGASGPMEFAALDGGADPIGLAISGDSRYLIVADRGRREVRVYQTSDGAIATVMPLDFTPSRLERLSADGLFVLNAPRRDEWMLVLDARQTPRVFFVPDSQKGPR